jgi:magnesium chelatase family protein
VGTSEALESPASVPYLCDQILKRPPLNRIDIYIEAPHLDYEKISENRLGESSASIRKRVQIARDIQNNWFSQSPDIICTSDMRIGEVG